MHTHINIYAYTPMHAHTHTHTCVCVREHVGDVHVCGGIYACICVYMYMCVYGGPQSPIRSAETLAKTLDSPKSGCPMPTRLTPGQPWCRALSDAPTPLSHLIRATLTTPAPKLSSQAPVCSLLLPTGGHACWHSLLLPGEEFWGEGWGSVVRGLNPKENSEKPGWQRGAGRRNVASAEGAVRDPRHSFLYK